MRAQICPASGPAPRLRHRSILATAPPPPLASPKPLESLNASERALDVAVATTSNLLNGGIFGGLFGLISGAWSTRTFAGAFSEARTNGVSWGGISGIYAGLQTASRVIRNKDDRVNNVVGACGSGAVFSLKNGPRAAAQGCVSFAALSYMIDVFTTPKDVAKEGMSDEDVLRKKRR